MTHLCAIFQCLILKMVGPSFAAVNICHLQDAPKIEHLNSFSETLIALKVVSGSFHNHTLKSDARSSQIVNV